MSANTSRYAGSHQSQVADGWQLTQLTQPSRLFGANGIRTGGDGRIYVAQVSGSQVSAINIDNGDIETISPKGGSIVAPDDLVFDGQGNLFVTEFTEGRVSVREANGSTRVVYGDMPGANPITVHNGRLFAGECRPGGRIMELDLYGGEPRILLDNVPMPNAMEVGPDGKLYIPIMGTNEIWRVTLEGGAHEVVATDLGVPDSVKFDSQGFIVSTQVASGQVLRINPNTGEKTVLATIAPGLDNCTFVNDRLFVSSISGQINEVLSDGSLNSLIHDGLQWPMGLATLSDGRVFVADGGYTYMMTANGAMTCIGMLFTPGFPGFTRGVICEDETDADATFLVTTGNGQVSRWTPATMSSEVLTEGYDRLYGLAKTETGAVIFAEGGAGRILSVHNGNLEELATGLNHPMGVALSAEGDCYVSEEGEGRILKITSSGAETVLDDLQSPQGIAIHQNTLYVADVKAKQLLAMDLSNHSTSVIAEQLPVGAPEGVVPKFLKALPPLTGPMVPFTGVTVAANGTVYVAADADGSVLALQQQ